MGSIAFSHANHYSSTSTYTPFSFLFHTCFSIDYYKVVKYYQSNKNLHLFWREEILILLAFFMLSSKHWILSHKDECLLLNVSFLSLGKYLIKSLKDSNIRPYKSLNIFLFRDKQHLLDIYL